MVPTRSNEAGSSGIISDSLPSLSFLPNAMGPRSLDTGSSSLDAAPRTSQKQCPVSAEILGPLGVGSYTPESIVGLIAFLGSANNRV